MILPFKIKIRVPKPKKGIVLVAVMVFTLIFMILGFSVLSVSFGEVVSSRNDYHNRKAFYAAEAGIEYGIANLNAVLSAQRRNLYLHPEGDICETFGIGMPVVEGFTFEEFAIEKVGEIENRQMDSGPYSGMEAIIQKYRIVSEVSYNAFPNVKARLIQWAEDQGFHLYQFAVFYNEDLEIEPGPTMTIYGRVHSNKDIYLESQNTLSIQSMVTSAADIFQGSKPGDTSGGNGTVRIMDSEDTYHVMDFDSSDPDWKNKAIDTWDGRVQSSDHGVQELRLPIPADVDPIEIIRRPEVEDGPELSDARYCNQADLKIIDGVAYDKNDNVVDLSYEKGGDFVNPFSTDKSFYNEREGKDIAVTEIDMAMLIESGKFPENGILYVSSELSGAGEQDGVRIVNGQNLPEVGLTMATDNPLYIQGDYNLNEKPSAVLCDAINVLSSGWQDDAAGFQDASGITINTSFVAGHEPTTDAGYGGGLENLPRFHEDWRGESVTWNGSMNSLWYSQIATGKWHYGSPYYTAPARNFGFDGTADLSSLPPGTPVMCRTYRSEWIRE